MPYPFGETVTHLDGTVTGRDGLGNDVYTFPVKAVYSGVAVAPQDGNGTPGNENVQGQEQVIQGLQLLGLPDGIEVSALDRFIVRENTYEVVGQPEDLQSPFTGWRPGAPVSLMRVTG